MNPTRVARARLVSCALLTILCSIPLSRATAQVAAGDTVRLMLRDVELSRGSFVRTDDASIYLRRLSGADTVRFLDSDFTRAEVLAARPRSRGSASAIGTAIGAGAGIAAGLVIIAMGPGHGSVSNAFTGIVAGGALGAVLGETVGVASSGVRREDWQTVDVRRVTTPLAVASVDTTVRVATQALLALHGDHVTPGDTVRLFAHGAEIVYGVIAAIDSASFFIIPMDNVDRVPYSRAGVDRADVQRGDRRRGGHALARGALIGLGTGAALVTLAIATNDPRDEGLGIWISMLAAGASTIIGTVAGGVTALTYTENWQPFDPITLRVLMAPS